MNEVKVGFFTLAAIIAFIYMSLKITSNQSGFGEHLSYRAITTDASNLFKKTPIKFSGINVGQITEIELADGKALITMDILKKVMMTEGTTLEVKSIGFLGDKYLELKQKKTASQEGKVKVKRLKELSLIPMKEGGGMASLVKDVSSVLEDVKVITGNIREMFETKEGEKPLFKEILENIKHVVANIDETTGSLGKLISSNKESLDNFILNLEEITKNILDQTDLGKRDSALSELKEILSNLNKMSDQLNRLVMDVREGKGTIGKFLVEEDIVDEVQQTLSGVKKLVGRVDQIKNGA